MEEVKSDFFDHGFSTNGGNGMTIKQNNYNHYHYQTFPKGDGLIPHLWETMDVVNRFKGFYCSYRGQNNPISKKHAV